MQEDPIPLRNFRCRHCLVLTNELIVFQLYGFKPEVYADRAALDADADMKPRFLSFKDNRVGISCDGINAVDRASIKDIQIYPEEGLEPVRVAPSPSHYPHPTD